MTERTHAGDVTDWTQLPLAPGGRSLIEASAGTGKTWTIAVLYLRLLLEDVAPDAQPLTPRRIVVTTFTDAAAQELRARLRARLSWAERVAADASRGVHAEVDASKPDLAWLSGRWRGADGATDRGRAARDRQRLRLALAELDLAPITTLHGLCARILREQPFASGSPFVFGELVAGDRVIDDLAEDLWRCLQTGADTPPDVGAAGSLDQVRKTLRICLRPGVGVWLPDARDIARHLPGAWADRIAGLAARKDVWQCKRRAPQGLRALAGRLRGADAPWTPDDHGKLGEAIDEIANVPAFREEHGFLVGVRRFLGYLASMPEAEVLAAWTRKVREWRDARLAASGRLTYDELIQRVHDAIAVPDGSLAERLFEEWPVALVDEFQDTDAQQYAILDRMYRDRSGARRGRLVMIGDPKQAIYRFRGGDITAYLAAAQDADAVLRIDTNYRSSRAYVAALDEWFERAGPVLSSDPGHPIRCVPVHASQRRDAQPYRAPDGEAERPLVVHFHPEVPASVVRRRRLALTACANQIVAMLGGGRHFIGDRPLAPGDIAVLLPTNGNVAELRALLQDRRVPCVGAGHASVFGTEWARELQVVLYAIEHAGDAGAVGAALATRLGGLDFRRLDEIREAPDLWQAQAQRFMELRRQWQREGVLKVVLDLARDAMRHVPATIDRERALTDLRHLGELLQERDDGAHGAGELLAWLAGQREGTGDDGADDSDQRQLRIESDAQRVRLATLHSSKGLEFPIVFLPLLWDHDQGSQTSLPVIHEPLCGRRIIGFGSDALAQFHQEGQDERFRVLYVALTRAIHACHVYALPPDRPAKAGKGIESPADPRRSALDAMLDRLGVVEGRLPEFRHVGWREGAWPWPDATFRAAAPAAPAEPRVLPEPRPAPFRNRWSFSALTRPRTFAWFEEEAADHEGTETDAGMPAAALEGIAPDPRAASPAHPALLELAGLRGTEFGNAVHAVFETRRVGVPLAQQADLVARALRAAGVRLGDLPPATAAARVAARLDGALAAELAPGLCLGAIPAERQRAEMEFHFVLDAVSIRRLREACAQHGDPGLVPPAIRATTLRGLMAGMIDLVFEHDGRFHVLDYKSNDLGRGLDHGLEPYRAEKLPAAMDEHHYRFQALLYTVAVDRYLRQRMADYDRDRHLGDAFYLFVRAAGLAPGVGVWRHRFGDSLLDAVDAQLAGGVREAAA